MRRTVGAIGYVELSFALSQSLACGRVQNREGKFDLPTFATDLSKQARPNGLR